MTKELHLFLGGSEGLGSVRGWYYTRAKKTWLGTRAALDAGEEIVFTTQLAALSFDNAEKLFVYTQDGVCHEITKGRCEGTRREIKASHDLVKLLLHGEFDWFRV